MGFYLYKGLKKPLTYFGLKGKYIFYAAGSIAGGFVLIIILNVLIGTIGLLIGGVITGAIVWYVVKIQDKNGLYSKTRNNDEIYIFPKRRMKIYK